MGIESLLQQNIQSAGLAGTDRLARNAMFPQGQMDKTQYAVPSQLPTSAETIRADYDAPTNAYTGLPDQPFAKGGITTLRYAEGGDTDAWDPTSGQVKLQKLSDPANPFSETTNVNYTIPKDSIKQFVPSDEGLGGQYILNDGSTMNVDSSGIVQSATPGRNDYTLNEQGYYQPTGENLTWRGDQNMLYKKIGGVDVSVPGIYHKGGYQDQQGNLRVDENGVPVALRPNYLDSGFGQSGLADAAPYIMAATLGGAGLAMAPGIAGAGFAGMVPVSETLVGGLGALGAGAGAAEGAAAGSGSWGLSPELAAELGLEGSTSGLGTSGAQGSAALEAMGLNTSGGMTAKQAAAAKMGLDLLSGGTNQAGTGGYAPQSQTATASPATIPNITRSGVTGYYGAAEAPDYRAIASLTPRTYLSKLHGVPGEQVFAAGGIANLGSYSDGGRLLKGPGDGMSDNIPATIADKQPARLADGEFVIPADVVSHLGNGSTDAGAKQLYAMMDRIRKARTGNKKQGKQINPHKFLP